MGGQFRRAQVDHPVALVDHGREVLWDPPPAGPVQAALERDRVPAGLAPGRYRQRGRCVRGQVGHQPGQVRARPGGERRPHPLVELRVVEAALGERGLEPAGRGVALGIGRADGVEFGHTAPTGYLGHAAPSGREIRDIS